MEDPFSIADPGGGDLWAVEEQVYSSPLSCGGLSKCEILCLYIFICNDSPRRGMCGIGAQATHAENLGGVPIIMCF